MGILERLQQEEEMKDGLWDEIDKMFSEALLDPDFEAKLAEMEDQIDQPVNQAQVDALVADLVTVIDGHSAWTDIQASPNLVTFTNHGIRMFGQRRQFIGIEFPVLYEDDEDGDDGEDQPFVLGSENEDSETEDEVSNIAICYYSEEIPADQAEQIQMPLTTMSADALRNFVREQNGRWFVLPDELQIRYLSSCQMGELIISPVFDNLQADDEVSGTTHAYIMATEDDLMACLGISVIRVPAEPAE